MSGPKVTGLLIRLPAGTPKPSVDALGATGFDHLEPLFEAPIDTDSALGAAGQEPARWFRAALHRSARGSGWEAVHAAADGGLGLARDEAYIEPDLVQPFIAAPPAPADLAAEGDLAAAGGNGTVDPPNENLPSVDRFAWFLEDGFSQLGSARKAVGDPGGLPGADQRVRIAHLDTGYDKRHAARPPHVVDEHNLIEDGDDATDPGADRFGPFDNPGHGTGTLGILAGGKVAPSNDLLGGAPQADLIPMRIAESVVLLRTSALARALDLIATGGADGGRLADVVSISMGGLASRAWADAVNKAYEAGVCIVAAAGNNFSIGIGGVPSRLIVYPARFRRVIAACGVMADRTPYNGLPFGTMQGNWGPKSKMATAMAAFTPNMPWAELGAPDIIDLDGAGTSSATPQIAAAAALWLSHHRDEVAAYDQPWQRVEAVRHALFSSAEKTADGGKAKRLGNGILQAAAALAVQPARNLVKTRPDKASLPFLKLFAGFGLAADSSRAEMFALEATQLVQQHAIGTGEPNPFDDLIADPDQPPEAIPREQIERFARALERHTGASKALRNHLALAFPATDPRPVLEKPPTPTSTLATPSTADIARASYASDPLFRRLRGYAIDPSLTLQLDTKPISKVTYPVPWETLDPGPVGEYLEVVDFDPAARCFYEPVDLDDPKLLAQDGMTPSEGSPQFHQQMVYAVASMTIHNFEHALGRKAMWAPGPPPKGTDDKNDSHFVRRLRVYPHALRTDNAFYSPNKLALLFGYFPASGDDPGGHMPGGMVFTCLSHDIVAHETAHALLHGMHRRSIEATNPDVLAFHEAFADIVALFQHFTLPEIVRHQMAATRGEIREQWNVLGELAGEFGRTTGNRNALRSAIGAYDEEGEWVPHEPDPADYHNEFSPHKRGAILVAAVFDAFLSIYEIRVADLLRLATGGSGVLEPGAIPPDLVHRLSDEAGKAAQHVLSMCVRALDYCPPVDITFGEYLRAIITADRDLVRDDDKGYRTAFIEAFRRRGLYPRDLRTLSAESLCWRRSGDDEHRPSQQLLSGLESLRDAVRQQVDYRSREEVFHFTRSLRRQLHGWLSDHLATDLGRQDCAFLGLRPGTARGKAPSFEVHSLRLANRVGPDGNLLRQVIVDILEERTARLDPKDRGSEMFTVEGGCTIVADLENLAIDYCIRKNAGSKSRKDRQREYVTRFREDTLHALYFGEKKAREQIAHLHGAG